MKESEDVGAMVRLAGPEEIEDLVEIENEEGLRGSRNRERSRLSSRTSSLRKMKMSVMP